ncbi:hypothetical protein HLB32_16630, partial [Streptomyces cacaoi]|nr:hypothetical protein [Streptomyces cacaoi]
MKTLKTVMTVKTSNNRLLPDVVAGGGVQTQTPLLAEQASVGGAAALETVVAEGGEVLQ